jgi:Ca2+-binding RTX toxin-like protein
MQSHPVRTPPRLLVLALTAAVALIPIASADAAVIQRAGKTIYYTAGQGERNDVRVSLDTILNQTVYTFTDDDATPIGTGGNLCDLINAVGMCTASGVTSIVVNVRDKDDTVTIATASKLGPVMTSNTLIGGRGVDVLVGGNGVDKLKGNNGKDSLRGRKGADVYKGGRGSDTLQTLDGLADTAISCGDGNRDLIRADAADPEPRSCELGKRGNRSKRR